MKAFEPFPKIPRLNNTPWVLTEKLDGTNGQVAVWDICDEDEIPHGATMVEDSGHTWLVRAGSRSRWLTPDSDNFGFAAWVKANAAQLVHLGPGRHFGEWYGCGIQRGYGLDGKRFALFNATKWADPSVRPACCEVVTVLATVQGAKLNQAVDRGLEQLRLYGSQHVLGYPKPEGIVIWHKASGQLYKALCEGDDLPKSKQRADFALVG